MSILDGLPKSKEDLAEALIAADKALENVLPDLRKLKNGNRAANFLASIRNGVPLGDLLGLSAQHLELFFAAAVNDVRFGKLEKAQAIATVLHLCEPLEKRFVYLLATTHQLANEFEPAAKFYIMFIALDATNPDGYARLGECLMGAREYDRARECFEAAVDFANKGHGSPGTGAHAQNLLNYLQQMPSGSVH